MAPSFSPLAEALDLGASRYSPGIVDSAVRLGTAGAFAPAAELLQHFTGVTMSPSTLRRLTLDAGAAVRQLELAFAAAPLLAEPPADVPLPLSVDGSMVPLQDGWHEVKLMAIGERRADGGVGALSYAATLGSAEAFQAEAFGEVMRRGVPVAPDVVSVNDGAEWIQGLVDLHCPQAHRVLDFAHAAGYLGQAAAEAFGEETPAGTAWFRAQREALRQEVPATVLGAVRALPAGEARDRADRYLTARQDQIAYRDFLARGWPIGSGCVESAHKGIVQARLKQRGMRWSRPGAEGVLALRIAQANDRWDEQWAAVGAYQRATRRTRTAHRRAARCQSVAPSKLVQDGRPTADHPWKQPVLRRPPRIVTTM